MSNCVWVSKDSWEKLWSALHNIQIRCDEAVLSPSAMLSGAGSSASLIISIPRAGGTGNTEYNGYFKIVDRTDSLEQDPDVTYDSKQYKIAICDGSSYDDEKGTSNNSAFYLNDGSYSEVPYTESAPFTGSVMDKFVQIVLKKKILFTEEETESGNKEEFSHLSVVIEEHNWQGKNTVDLETGILTCRYTVGRVRFPEYNLIRLHPELYKKNEVSTMKIIQDHCAGPLRLFWYISCWDMQKNEEEEE